MEDTQNKGNDGASDTAHDGAGKDQQADDKGGKVEMIEKYKYFESQRKLKSAEDQIRSLTAEIDGNKSKFQENENALNQTTKEKNDLIKQIADKDNALKSNNDFFDWLITQELDSIKKEVWEDKYNAFVEFGWFDSLSGIDKYKKIIAGKAFAGGGVKYSPDLPKWWSTDKESRYKELEWLIKSWKANMEQKKEFYDLTKS